MVGGVNAGLSIYDRLTKKNNDVNTGNPNTESDETLFDDFLVHLKGSDSKIVELNEDLKKLKVKNLEFEEEFVTISKKERELEIVINELSQEIPNLKNLTSKFNNQVKNFIIFNSIAIAVIIGVIAYLFHIK